MTHSSTSLSIAMSAGLVCCCVLSAPAAAIDCQLFLDDEQMKLETLIKTSEFAKAMDLGRNLFRHYDDCAKSSSTDAESRVMNRLWRADVATAIASIHRRTNRPQEGRQWLAQACTDYRAVADATIVDTTSRKMAGNSMNKACRK